MRFSIWWLAAGLLSLVACQPTTTQNQSTSNEAPVLAPVHATGDTAAIALAQQVMEASGGYQNWQQAHYITWNFFGARRHLWDKQTGWLRIESLNRPGIWLYNLRTGEGRVWLDSAEVTHPDSLAKVLPFASRAWNNDAYWLLMPFKLLDAGVVLDYAGQDTTAEGAAAEVLQLSFSGVGDTPQNGYRVYVDTATHRVVQWDYFQQTTDSVPSMVTPWQGYAQFGGLWLSQDRGGNRQLTQIAVLDSVPDGAFTQLAPLNWASVMPSEE